MGLDLDRSRSTVLEGFTALPRLPRGADEAGLPADGPLTDPGFPEGACSFVTTWFPALAPAARERGLLAASAGVRRRYRTENVRILWVLAKDTRRVPRAVAKWPVPPVIPMVADWGCIALNRTTPCTVRLPFFTTAVTTQSASVCLACGSGIRVSVHTPES